MMSDTQGCEIRLSLYLYILKNIRYGIINNNICN